MFFSCFLNGCSQLNYRSFFFWSSGSAIAESKGEFICNGPGRSTVSRGPEKPNPEIRNELHLHIDSKRWLGSYHARCGLPRVSRAGILKAVWRERGFTSCVNADSNETG